MLYLLLGIAIATGLLRVVGLKAVAYQAVAHLFVGGLFGGAIACQTRSRWLYLALAVGLTVLETVCFFQLR